MHLKTEEIIEAYISSTKCVDKKYTLYELIVVTNIDTMKNYQIIHKRYSDFWALNKLIKKKIKELPVFPCKVYNKLASEVVNERVNRFNFYIKYLCMLVTKKEVDEESRKMILNFLTK
jgi:hypothetical protein